MVTETQYSAGLMSQSFWFLEFKKVVKLRQSDMDYEDIRKKCIDDNLFGAAKEYRALRMAGYVINRVKTMDDQLMEIFLSSELETQKLINLAAIMKTDRLFFEFVYEVYREKSILGVGVLENADVNVFFTQKEAQSELIAGWTDSTKQKLRRCYLNFMTDANLLTEINKKKTITPPIVDILFERYLISSGEEVLLKALTGVN